MEHLENIFMITLNPNDSDSRWKQYENITEITKFDAINSKTSDLQSFLKQHDFKFSLKCGFPHYNRCAGAPGCFLSHYYLWEKIALNNSKLNPWYLILEDDVDPQNVSDFLSNRLTFNWAKYQKYELINLNCRNVIWNGSESYLIKPSAARKLIKHCNRTISAPMDMFLFKKGIHAPELRPIKVNTIHLAEWNKIRTIK